MRTRWLIGSLREGLSGPERPATCYRQKFRCWAADRLRSTFFCFIMWDCNTSNRTCNACCRFLFDLTSVAWGKTSCHRSCIVAGASEQTSLRQNFDLLFWADPLRSNGHAVVYEEASRRIVPVAIDQSIIKCIDADGRATASHSRCNSSWVRGRQ